MDSRIFGPKRLACHLAVLVVFLVCLRLGWWQWQRSQALGGAAQNLAYALLWPVFGSYAVYVWIRLLKMEIAGYQPPPGDGNPILGRPDENGDGPAKLTKALVPYVPPDPELVAYNAYLSALNQEAAAKEAAKRGPAVAAETTGLTPGMSAALLRYRVIAIVVGIGLIALVLVGMPLKYLNDDATVVAIVGPAHGALYVLYLIAGFELSQRGKWSWRATLAVLLAGTIPFLSFVAERVVTRRIRAQQPL